MSTPLRTLVTDLLHDPSARATFAADPARYLDEHGWDGLDGADVGTTLDALRHELPIDEAVRLGAVDTDAFGEGAVGAISGLQAAAAAFDVDWSDDPATTIDDVDDVAREDTADDVDNPFAEDDSVTFEVAVSATSNVTEAEVEVEVEVEGEVEVEDDHEWEDPLLAVGDTEPFVDLDFDLERDPDFDVPDIDDGLDDG